MDRRHVNVMDGLPTQSSQGDEDSFGGADATASNIMVNTGHEGSPGGFIRSARRTSVSLSAAQQAAQRDYISNGSAQMIPPMHRRRSVRRRGSLLNGTRLTSKANVTVHLEGDSGGIEMQAASEPLLLAARMREKYKSVDKGQLEGTERLVPPVVLSFESGIIQFSDQRTCIVPWEQFYDDVMALFQVMQHPHCRRACTQRLQVLEEKYNLSKLCNEGDEGSDGRHRRGCGGVFAECTKVDNSVYLSSIMNAQWLFEYIRDTIEEQGGDIVRLSADKDEPQSLERVCEILDFADMAQLGVESLGLLPATEKRLYRYDALDPELNRAGRNAAELLRLFLTPDTLNGGQYFADAVRPILETNDGRKRCVLATESILEVTGLLVDEWERLAHWAHESRLVEYQHNQWLIALPRRKIRQGGGAGDEFEHHQQHIESLFLPLFMATLAPEDTKNTQLASFLAHVGGFVIVSDEEERESDFQRKPRRPMEVPWGENVSDLYFAYYVWANLCSLNAFRRRKGLNTFQLRAIAGGRSTQVDVLVYSYLMCDCLGNGVVLNQQPVLEYLYGLQRIGVTFSPLSSNGLGMPYMKNPFLLFFRRGLSVALCTDHPLFFHHAKDPLIEEYGTASKLYQLSGIDVCEIAMNSVVMSSFPLETKALWLGESFIQEGIRGNVYELSRVPTSRLELRYDMWQTEIQILVDAVRKNQRGDTFINNTTVCTAVSSAFGGDRTDNFPSTDGASAFPNTTTTQPANSRESFGAGSMIPNAMISSSLPTLNIASVVPTSLSSGNPNTGSVGMPTPFIGCAYPLTVPGSGAGGVGEISLSPTGTAPPLSIMPSSKFPFVVVDPHINYPRVAVVGLFERESSQSAVAQQFHRALELRAQYVRLRRIEDIGTSKEFLNRHEIEDAFRRTDTFDENEWMYKTVEGVLVPHEVHQIPRLPKDMFHYDDFRAHVQELRLIIENIHVCNFATRRLKLLEHKFMLHLAVNRSLEAGSTANKASQNRDFYQATKVDNNVCMETGMTARHLLNFIVSKANNSGDDIVSHQEGREPQTLRQLLQELKISPDTLTVDDLNVQVDATLGVATGLYTPEGRDELLTLLLKTDNQMKGRYFAELTKLTFESFKSDRFTFTENRLPIYGASDKEWGLLSDWFDTHGMASFHNQWMVQVPRIYSYLRKTGKVRSFAEYIENIFKPLWAVSLHPSKDPRLFYFVNHISGFDCVEDERRSDIPLHMASKAPHEWISEEEPPFNYYMYHMWANIYSLNEFRRRRNFSTFTFRPSCGETGPVEHLMGGFLLANAINYGVTLAKDPPLQYLFYLAQIGVTVSPLSNNTKVLGYLDNPFPQFFRCGLKVTLGTDSPLMFHHTQEPLLEEYSIASKVWKLSPNDMCEIARNSVLLSGFDASFKRKRLGDLFFLSSSKSNDAMRTHLSDIRVAYRYETYHTELSQLEHVANQEFPRALLTLNEESARETEFHEVVNKKDAPKVGLIDSNADEADLVKLQQHRQLMQRQSEELNHTLKELQRQNKQLTEKLAEERTRDQHAQLLRRYGIEERWDQRALSVHEGQLLGLGSGVGTEGSPVDGARNMHGESSSHLFSAPSNELHSVHSPLAANSSHNNNTTTNTTNTNTHDNPLHASGVDGGDSGGHCGTWDGGFGASTADRTGPFSQTQQDATSNADGGGNMGHSVDMGAANPHARLEVSAGEGLVTFWENLWGNTSDNVQQMTDELLQLPSIKLSESRRRDSRISGLDPSATLPSVLALSRQMRRTQEQQQPPPRRGEKLNADAREAAAGEPRQFRQPRPMSGKGTGHD